MKTESPAPLVSDELAIQCKKDADEMYPPHLAPDEIIGDHFMLVRLAVAKALYKERKDLSKMRAERDELVGALRRMRKPFKVLNKEWALDWGPVNGACHHADRVLSKYKAE